MCVLRLALRDYNLVEATSAEQALREFLRYERDIDLLIADVSLPVSSGIHVALLLRDHRYDLAIVLTSGYPAHMWSDQDAADLRRLGSLNIALLQKPFLPAELLKIANGLLDPPSCADSTSLRSVSMSGPIEPAYRTPYGQRRS